MHKYIKLSNVNIVVGNIIQIEKTIIPACDVSLRLYERILSETADMEEIGAYKIGFELGLSHGLPRIVELTRAYTDKPIIYDHQKAGTDIPETGKGFARTIKAAGIDAIILVPQAGPKTEEAWIEAALNEGLKVIVGGLMTHKKYTKSRGGYIDDGAIQEMYINAAKLGVTDFVAPMNKPESIRIIKSRLESANVVPTFYMPGFLNSLSNISSFAGNSWHAIIGRALYNSQDIKAAARGICSNL